MERVEVYERINGERDYQEWRWNSDLKEDRVPDEDKSPAEWLNYINQHLSVAETANYYFKKKDVMNEIRKIAALAVRAMEIHGCPERQIPEPPIV